MFNVLKFTASCQPEQSIEPDSQKYGISSDLKQRGTNSNSSTNSGKQGKTKKGELFVPIHKTIKKVSKKEKNLNRALQSIQKSLKNDPTHELLSLHKEDSEKQQQRDGGFFTFMKKMLTTPVITMQSTPLTLIVLHITI